MSRRPATKARGILARNKSTPLGDPRHSPRELLWCFMEESPGPRVPTWLRLAQQIDGAILTSVEYAFDGRHPDPDLGIVPYAAALHLRACVETGFWANRQGYHSAAIGMLRHSVEALTLIDLGFQDPQYNSPLLSAWKGGRKSVGEVRACLERDVWPSYGRGLWSESWAEFFGSLARSVQPFAHYTSELMYWQFFVPTQPHGVLPDGTYNILTALRCRTNDPVKAARLTLFSAMIIWTLGRILIANEPTWSGPREELDALGVSIANSKLLDKGDKWSDQLLGLYHFKPGIDWIDP